MEYSAGASRWRRLVAAGAAVGVATIGVAMAGPARAATSVTLNQGVLTIFGDSQDNVIVLGRTAAGLLTLDGQLVATAGPQPSVGDVQLIKIFGLGGDDRLAVDETNGPLPASTLFGGDGNDTLTGGSAADLVFGEGGNDILRGNGGNDQLFGGPGDDTLTGGTGLDLVFGQDGNDLLVANAGDGSDVEEGGDGVDTVVANGSDGVDHINAIANGSRVQLDGFTPAGSSLDIGTAEKLVVNANGGDDLFLTSGDLAPLISLTVDGGPGDDTITGGTGADLLIGGTGNDRITGERGDDVALLGDGNDTFQWLPGHGNDTVEGQSGTDTLRFSGNDANEKIDLSANGSRVRVGRDVNNVLLDVHGIETVDTVLRGGADTLTVNDLHGTDVSSVHAALGDGPDGQPDRVVVNGTDANDAVKVTGSASTGALVTGAGPAVGITGSDGPLDGLTVSLLGGNDFLDASGLAAGAVSLTGSGGGGDDVLVGSAGDDVLNGDEGDDVLIGLAGLDRLDGGAGSNVVIQ